MGNHDYLKQDEAFFTFLNHHPKIRFINRAAVIDGNLFLPYSKNPTEDWAHYEFNDFPFIFMHQTFNGAVSENGQKMSSQLSGDFHCHNTIYSGDIHVPQVIGDVTYVGSPYPVRFGDSFKARCILRKEHLKEVDLYYPTIKRATLDLTATGQLKQSGLGRGDQTKIRMRLSAADRPLFDSIRREVLEEAKSLGIDVVSFDLTAATARRPLYVNIDNNGKADIVFTNDIEHLLSFSDEHELPGSVLDTGLNLLEL